MGDVIVMVALGVLVLAMLAGASALAALAIVYLTGLSMGASFLIALAFFILLGAVGK